MINWDDIKYLFALWIKNTALWIAANVVFALIMFFVARIIEDVIIRGEGEGITFLIGVLMICFMLFSTAAIYLLILYKEFRGDSFYDRFKLRYVLKKIELHEGQN